MEILILCTLPFSFRAHEILFVTIHISMRQTPFQLNKVRSEAVGYVVIDVLFTGVFLSFDLIVFNFEFRFHPPSVFVVELIIIQRYSSFKIVFQL